MTREEAIDVLKRNYPSSCFEDLRKAVDIAIKALSAQPEPPFEVQDILDYLDTALHPIISPEHWNVYSELHDMISTLPSAQPEPQWITFSERRPWEGQQILVCAEDGVMWMTVFRSLIGFSGAWLPLPEPYKGEP